MRGPQQKFQSGTRIDRCPGPWFRGDQHLRSVGIEVGNLERGSRTDALHEAGQIGDAAKVIKEEQLRALTPLNAAGKRVARGKLVLVEIDQKRVVQRLRPDLIECIDQRALLGSDQAQTDIGLEALIAFEVGIEGDDRRDLGREHLDIGQLGPSSTGRDKKQSPPL